MTQPLVNTFDEGEEQDLLIKENETWEMDFALTDVDDVTGDETPINLTGATIAGGIKLRYEDKALLKAFTIASPYDNTGLFTATMLLGYGVVPEDVSKVAIDLIVKLASGQVIRSLAGFFTVSRGVTPLP